MKICRCHVYWRAAVDKLYVRLQICTTNAHDDAIGQGAQGLLVAWFTNQPHVFEKKTPATSVTSRFLAEKLIFNDKMSIQGLETKRRGALHGAERWLFYWHGNSNLRLGEWASHTLSLSLKLSWISQGKTHLRQPNLTANLALKADNLEEKTEKFDVANLLHPRLNLSYSGDHHGQRRCEAVGETSHHQADHVLLTYSTSGPWCLGRI